MTFSLFLALLSGLLWTIVYIDSIRIGLKDKSYAMPLWALGLNIAWEFLHSFIAIVEGDINSQVIINAVWFLFDIGLLYTFFRYGKKHFPQQVSKKWFYVWGIIAVAVSFLVQYAFIIEFTPLAIAATYSAYLQNLLMSILFIVMLVQRRSSEGQTMLIAWSKFIGSLAPTILVGIIGAGPVTEPNLFVLLTGILMAVFDIAYIILLAKVKKNEKENRNSELLF